MRRTTAHPERETRDDPPLGLIAGEGRLPVLIARGMRAAGRRVGCVGLRDQFDADLPEQCDAFRTAGIIQLGRWVRLLKRLGAHEATMVGRVNKVRIYDPLYLVRQMPDLRAARIWFGRLRHDRRNDAILRAVADELAAEDITLIDSTAYIQDQLADPGVMGAVRPSSEHAADIAFGLPIVERMGDLDIGQAIAIKDREVIAVEAIEGTDRMIERAGALCRRSGWALIKTGKPNQDMRFDVPTVGVNTIEKLRHHGGGCLALEAGKVIMLDKAEVIEAANEAGIAVVGVTVESG